MPELRPDIYISADVETDGPIPGPFSLLSFALTVAATYDGENFRIAAPGETSLYSELRPISGEFQQEAMDVNGLDRHRLQTDGLDPSQAMEAASSWVSDVAGDHRPVLVAYPVAFDWSFLHWYFVNFAPSGSPFGFSSCLDIRTLYQATAGTVFDDSGKSSMPTDLQPSSPHTHNALDDAIEQGQLFANVFSWALLQRGGSGNGEHEPHAPSWLAPHLHLR